MAEEKTPIDFCFAYEDGRSMPLSDFLFQNRMSRAACGMTPLNNFDGCFVLYYDFSANNGFPPKGFAGIEFDDLHELRLSTIPPNLVAIAPVFYDRGGYIASLTK